MKNTSRDHIYVTYYLSKNTERMITINLSISPNILFYNTRNQYKITCIDHYVK